MNRSRLCFITLAVLLLPGMASMALAEAPCLLKASAPGAYAVRFWPDRIVLTYSTKAEVAIKVQLPAAARWARLDGAEFAATGLKWDRAGGTVTANLPAGDHTLLVGWAGAYQKPAEGQKLPVLLDGRPAGSLVCRFDLQKMTAEGSAACPTGTVRVRLNGATAALQPVLTVGGTVVEKWAPCPGGLQAEKPVAVMDNTAFALTLTSYNLLKSPVTALELQAVQTALEPRRLDKMPAPGLLIEAENIAAEGLGKAEISEKHFQTSGGKSIFNNSGSGHWLEYKFVVEQAGTYDLFVRAATQEAVDMRSLTLDGKPLPGLGLIRFPGTGGWGYSAAEWAALQLTGLEKVPSLTLTAGEHVLRLTGESSSHLNLDCFVLTRR